MFKKHPEQANTQTGSSSMAAGAEEGEPRRDQLSGMRFLCESYIHNLVSVLKVTEGIL